MSTNRIPEEIIELPQWVLWGYEERDGKLTKVPYQPRGRLYRARSNDPRTWASFDTAMEMWRHHGEHVAGIGFVFSADDPYCGIDLDNCYPSDAAEIAAWAEGILERFADTYCEQSPSKTGVKIWCRANAPRCGKWAVEAGAVEIYDHGRFFTVTGRSAGIAVITDHQTDIEALVANLDQDRHRHHAGTRAVPEVIAKGQRHKTLLSLAGSMVRRGMIPEAVEAALLVTNQKQCDPPYEPKHIQKLVASTAKWKRK
jgi:primase-polymerase (primpol)-like protein